MNGARSDPVPGHGYARYSPASLLRVAPQPQENQGKVVINISDRTTDEAAINTSEVVLELLLETFLTTHYMAKPRFLAIFHVRKFK